MAIAVYLLLMLRLPGKLIFRFGLFNLVTLVVLLGWKVALVALGFVVLVWTILTLLKSKLNPPSRYLMFVSFFPALLFLFSLHKLNLANTEFSMHLKQIAPWLPVEALLLFFTTLSFSYVFVRCIDLARSCIFGNTPLVDPISLMGYLMPFHMLVAGPVNIYDEHARVSDSNPPPMTPSKVLLIINEITTGLFYKFVLSEGIRIYFYGINGNISTAGLFDPFILVLYVFLIFVGTQK